MSELSGREIAQLRGWRVTPFSDGRWAVFNGPREAVPVQCFRTEDDAYAFVLAQARQDRFIY